MVGLLKLRPRCLQSQLSGALQIPRSCGSGIFLHFRRRLGERGGRLQPNWYGETTKKCYTSRIFGYLPYQGRILSTSRRAVIKISILLAKIFFSMELILPTFHQFLTAGLMVGLAAWWAYCCQDYLACWHCMLHPKHHRRTGRTAFLRLAFSTNQSPFLRKGP